MGTALRSPLDRDPFDSRIVIWAEAHDVRIIFQKVMHDPAIVRIHRFQLNRPAGNTDGISNLTNPLPQLVIAHRAPMAHIDLHPWGIPVLRLQYPV